ncbi:hypothetical protein OG455_27300 [Kitasatospora sp. NBC_01287]|uniref:hypothetical protein n=1 Tax=Kitasatospora sp. NBC_01287 TaxID=2903573 RepID=UPI0022554A00|nr:hypothetical protein [Kitasatospora sp. NBC_01287]MCX4749166.1 hypothetical protein [Kitasatospora sp. NBC_01287]
MKIIGERRVAVEAASALLDVGVVVGAVVVLSDDPKPPAGPVEGSPEWSQALDAKIKRSAELGRVRRDIIEGRGQEATGVLCAVEWGKLDEPTRADLDQYAFAGGCRRG